MNKSFQPEQGGLKLLNISSDPAQLWVWGFEAFVQTHFVSTTEHCRPFIPDQPVLLAQITVDSYKIGLNFFPGQKKVISARLNG